MSHSYRKPYAACCGCGVSAKKDKVMASRGVRRAQNALARRMAKEPELGYDLAMPHFRACPGNNVYDWVRDGRQRLQIPTARDWSDYMLAVHGLGWRGLLDLRGGDLVWPPPWYAAYLRK